MKKKILIFSLFFVLLLTGCGNDQANNPNVKKEKNEDVNIKALVEDYSVGKIKNESASITSKELIVTKEDKNEVVYDISDEDFFVSIAPYIHETHPCTNHSLTGCQGEMVNEEFDIYIEDSKGNVIVDDTLKTGENGFIDLWLPRNQTFKTKIEHDGKVVESEISTNENDGTCITTMQLT